MRGRLLFVSTLLVSLFIGSSAFAQQAELDLKGLSEEQKAQLIIQAEKMKKETTPQGIASTVASNISDPQKLNEWVDLGKNVGLALTAVAKELGVASDQILKSDTGKIALALIVWKVMGKDILDIVGGTATWFVVTSIILWSFSFFHMAKKVKHKDGSVEFVRRYEFTGKDAKVTSAWVHGIAFTGITLICMAIVF